MQIGLGIGIPFRRNTILAAFSPKSLFAASEPGVWYDPSDMSTMFQDAAGTTPVTAVEQPVGLMLDKSRGLGLGPELVTNGDFSNGFAPWWQTANAWSVVGQAAKSSGADASYLYQDFPGGIVGKTFEVKFTIASSGSVGLLRFYSDNGTTPAWTASYNAISNDQVITLKVLKTLNNRFYWQTAGGWNGAIDNISVRELLGNHATQTTSASRPVLSARVNLLMKTEEFDDVYWRLFGVASTTSSITEDTLNSAHEILSPDGLIVTGQVTTISIEAKAGTATHIQLTFTGGSTNPFANFDLVNGVVSLSGNSPISTTIVNAGNGYFRCTLTSSGAGAGAGAVSICLIDNNPTATRRPLYAGTGKSAFIRKVDLRVANVGTNLPAYQRVNTATDYDTAGFPMYLRFDGVDDWLVTPSIDFTSTNKMTVFAGVRKLSDAAGNVIAELSPNSSTNSGVFAITCPSALGIGDYRFRSKGTLDGVVDSPAAYLAPLTNIVTGLGDIAGDQSILRVNSIQAAISTADQGTGNYLAYPLYIGRRGGTTLPFNGRIYSLIIRGAQSTAQQISDTETYVNNKTKAYA